MKLSSSSSSRQGPDNTRKLSGHMLTLYQRLYHALDLGFGSNDKKEKIWHSKDVEIQRVAIRSISAFIDSISPETSNYPLVKESISDMVGAMGGILEHRNGTLLAIAANVALKLVDTLPSSILQSNVLDLVLPLSSLLSSHQLHAAISCASALNKILSIVSTKREKEIWEILKEREIVSLIVSNLHEFSVESKPTEYFEEMASLLSTILVRRAPSRCRVWSDTKFMQVLEDVCAKSDFPVKVTVLKVYSALALCNHGAKKLLCKGESFLQVMVSCMDSSQPHSIRMVGLQLAQHLARSEEVFLRMVSLCCEPFVRSIVNGMTRSNLRSGKIANRETSLIVEACRLALVTCWGGDHHISFWKAGIDRVLLDLLLVDFHQIQKTRHLQLKEQICIVKEVLDANLFIGLRPYIWEILGSLAAHSGEDFQPELHGDEFAISNLIICACLSFTDSNREGRQFHQSNTVGDEAATRAVLMMIYSRCKYFATKARLVMSEVLKPRGKEHLKYILANLNYKSLQDQLATSDVHLNVINIMGLACYSGLLQYRKHVIKHKGIKTLSGFMSWCLSNHVNLETISVSTRLYNTKDEFFCCWISNEWEGKDSVLLFCLWGLAELLHRSEFVENNKVVYSSQLDCSEAQFTNKLQEICVHNSSPGLRWYAAYILSFFGIFGFPTKFGKRIGKSLNETEYADLELILSSGESFNVHGVFLKVRCPAFLPPPDDSKIRSDNTPSGQGDVILCSKLKKQAYLSSHVERQELVKLLEFVYLGHLKAEEELVKKLKTFAKRCNLRPLVEMLSRKTPKWGTPVPSCDLILALGSAGEHFWDIILQAKENELLCWSCDVCSMSKPHIHTHKVILSASCDYLRAMFQSGMQESHAPIIRVPISWEALVKIVDWFYSDELPKPASGCLWDNLDTDEKLQELLPYIELCWLAEFWLLKSIQEECSKIIISCMNSDRRLSVKIIQIASEFSQWKLAEAAANYMAPIYRQLHDSGELEDLDEALIDLVRAASVRLSQQVGNHFSS